MKLRALSKDDVYEIILEKIKIGLLHSDRIGHFAGNTELNLCYTDFRKDNKRETGSSNPCQRLHELSAHECHERI